MGVILDTSILIAFERRAADIEMLFRDRGQEPVGMSVITAAELLHGVHRADTPARRMKRAAYVGKVIDQLTLYPFDLAAARIYAELWATLQKQGNQIGAHDAMIAATALSLGFSISTLTVRDYEKIDGLTLERLQ
ncbi:MAG: type II toxin-antitoxin system VapC family toxin [Nitrospiraceae bacterium]